MAVVDEGLAGPAGTAAARCLDRWSGEETIVAGFRIVQGVNFGGRSDWGRTGEKASNKRSEMWLSAREWLQRGALPRDELLAAAACGGVGCTRSPFTHTRQLSSTAWNRSPYVATAAASTSPTVTAPSCALVRRSTIARPRPPRPVALLRV